ncbi:unnamed protein product [Staurois parvus]|uniref:Uncharacterized protein n=1 Tax=Staurois parvus TaxID=386267 RepID=A0ABN9B7Z8_9NEOB|nr:unnamed protein product [Staurois parvus]
MDRICGLSIMDRTPIHYAQSADLNHPAGERWMDRRHATYTG